MSSDQILFDSEEFVSQNKENITDSENITLSSELKQILGSNLDDFDSRLAGNERKDAIDSDQTQSSQNILDSILNSANENDRKIDDDQTQSSQDVLDGMNKAHPPSKGLINETPDSLLDTCRTENNGGETEKDFTGTPTSNNGSISLGNTPNEENKNTHESMDLSEEMESSELIEEPDNDLADTSVVEESDSVANKKAGCVGKQCMLPLSRVKLIMKTDPNVKVVSAEATVLAAIAAEMFLKFTIEETARITLAKKKKTMIKQHFDEAIQGLEVTEFLEGMMEDD